MRRRISLVLAMVAGSVGASLALAGPAAAADYDAHNCFGYVGHFKVGSHIQYADWNGDGSTDECFGVSPGRHIYHAWKNSGGWKEMPGDGRADDTLRWSVTPGERIRLIPVYIAASGNHWYSEWIPNSDNGWYGWYRCSAGTC